MTNVVVFLQLESVALALQLLDESDVRGTKISVQKVRMHRKHTHTHTHTQNAVYLAFVFYAGSVSNEGRLRPEAEETKESEETEV